MVKLVWQKGLQFLVQDGRNHTIVVDTEKEFGGLDEGFRPMDLLLVSLAGCMGMDIVGILKKKGGKIDTFEIVVNGERAPDHPRRYTKISIAFKCEGDYKREDLLRSFELSRDKYCSVVATLKDAPKLEFVI
ncbi:MAG: OsmC family protein [candidate division WOR-3 bacterium]|nr:MAG: OsmC family protein [candidate division WOR-3 bacterium]